MAEAELAPVLQRNIRALEARRKLHDESANAGQRLARRVASIMGTVGFAALNAVFFSAWLVLNKVWAPIDPFDPDLIGLTVVAALEAIFLSIFVLINQRHEARVADERADLGLQIGLLSEHEITRLITLMAAVAEHLGVEAAADPEIEEAQKDVAPEIVLDELGERESAKRD